MFAALNDLMHFRTLIVKYIAFVAGFACKRRMLADRRFQCAWKDRKPCLADRTATTGFDAHYVYHTAWAARVLHRLSPERHVDIGSCLRFVTMVSAFVQVEFHDYRQAKLQLSGLRSGQADVTRLPFADKAIASLSCMHVVEHIGLERYGDPLDPRGDIKAMRELARVLAPNGYLLFVVPVGGVARIQYNAHRIYRAEQVITEFPSLELLEFALVTDDGNFVTAADIALADAQQYGCGCFLFRKPAMERIP